jgi:phage terminase large subunit GpA-like protein
VSEWAEQKRFLTKKETARPGKFSWDYMPYLKEIADHFSVNSPTREIVVMKGVQVGATDSIFMNVIGYYMDWCPTSIMLVSADKGLLKEFKNVRITSMINNSGLNDKIRADNSTRNSRRQGETATMVEFTGGFLRLAGASNPNDLRSMSINIILLDEIDAYKDDLGGEGSPIDLATARTTSFKGKKKIGYISTPTTKQSSKIEPLYLNGDREKYFLMCPYCGKRQVLLFYNYNGGLYPEDKKEYNRRNKISHSPYGFNFNSDECRRGNYSSVGYKCKYCGEIMREHHKRGMNRLGRWVSTKRTKVPFRVSFHIPAFFSPAKEWWEIVKDFLETKGNINKLKTFKNLVEGVPFDDTTKSITKHNVYPKRMEYLPNQLQPGALFVVAACDVQHDRLEVQIVAVGRRFRTWTLDYRIFYGDTACKNNECWENLKKIGSEKFNGGGWKTPLLAEMIGVDSSDGARTQTVYEFCVESNSELSATVFYPIKGQDDTAKTRNELRTVQLSSYDLTLIEPYVNLYKNKLSSWLSREWRRNIEDYPFGWAEFPTCFSDQQEKTIEKFLHQLTAEKKVKYVQGAVIRYKWRSDGRRNEAFDTFVYCLAMADYYIEHTCKEVLIVVDENGNFKVDADTVFDDIETYRNSL